MAHAGHLLQGVAMDLGYESTSSFVTMFRKALGTSPARYITRRLDLASAGGGADPLKEQRD